MILTDPTSTHGILSLNIWEISVTGPLDQEHAPRLYPKARGGVWENFCSSGWDARPMQKNFIPASAFSLWGFFFPIFLWKANPGSQRWPAEDSRAWRVFVKNSPMLVFLSARNASAVSWLIRHERWTEWKKNTSSLRDAAWLRNVHFHRQAESPANPLRMSGASFLFVFLSRKGELFFETSSSASSRHVILRYAGLNLHSFSCAEKVQQSLHRWGTRGASQRWRRAFWLWQNHRCGKEVCEKHIPLLGKYRKILSQPKGTVCPDFPN